MILPDNDFARNGLGKMICGQNGMVQKGGQAPRKFTLFPALAVDWLGASPRF
jgi:hypothetical protein